MAKKKRAARTSARTTRKATALESVSVEKLAWVILLSVVALVSAYITLAQWATVRVPAAVVQSQVVALTNGERTANLLGQLTESPLLTQAAQAKANDMASKGYFSHTGPDGQMPWSWFTEVGYDYRYAGENLAVRFSDSKQVVDAWMASPTHKANIVKPQYTEIGIGIADGTYQGRPVTFVVQFFGTPQIYIERELVTEGSAAQTSPTVAPAESGVPSVAGAETTAPVAKVSIFTHITNLLAFAWRSLTASVAGADSVVVGQGASTER